MSAAYFENDELVKGLKALPAEAKLQSYDEPPSRLDMAISLFTRQGSSESRGAVHARSVRIPSIENTTIEALAQYSGLSVNKVICQLLEVALDEVFQGLNDDQRAEIFAIRSRMFANYADQEHEQAKPGEC